MDIRNPRSLVAGADEALRVGRKPREVALWYAGLITLVSLAVMALDYAAGKELDKATGLSNMGLNAILSTVQTITPVVQMLAQMCLSLGYLYAMLRIGRKLYADKNDLKEGLRRFGPMIRMFLIQTLLYLALGMALVYPITIVYMFTPLSDGLLEATAGMTEAQMNAMLQDPAQMEQLMGLMMPFLIVFAVIFLVAMIPIRFHFRMANYLLVDNPRRGAFQALRESFRMMRRNCLKLLKVDLHLWWYHALMLLAGLLAYGDLLLALLGISLPVSSESGFYLFQALYLLAMFGIYYFLRNRVELTYIMAYETLRPKEQQSNSVVLGNIFNM